MKSLPYESGMHHKDSQVNAESMAYSIAPAEGQKLIGILTDEYFENPTKYPQGTGGLKSLQEKSLTVRK